MSNKEISTELSLSEGIVRNYLSTILSKLDLRDRTSLQSGKYSQVQPNTGEDRMRQKLEKWWKRIIAVGLVISLLSVGFVIYPKQQKLF